ncbi:hypothetical protein F2Q69_00019967 [Brassica cretica]|uniref:Uncharacterized protein n=1 Tax=Brassica cretica TaxID=69181 RepID=A0A8S9QMN0_BRACR|nr:hypothetical protein F2Q69_00019967 [Brassica cretica]
MISLSYLILCVRPKNPDLLRRDWRVRPSDAPLSFTLVCLCFTIITPLPSLCFRSLASESPSLRSRARGFRRRWRSGLFWSRDAVSCRGYGRWSRLLSAERERERGSGSIATIVWCGLWFSPNGSGTLTVSLGFASIYGGIKDSSKAVMFQRRVEVGCGVGCTRSLQSSMADYGSCWCVEWSPTQSSMAVSSSPWRFTCLSGFINSRQEASRICHSVAVSLLGLATIPVPVKGRLIRHWPICCTSYVATVASFCSIGKWFQALCDVVYNSDLVASAKFMVLLKRHEKSRHPRQGGEPHLLVIIVNGK